MYKSTLLFNSNSSFFSSGDKGQKKEEAHEDLEKIILLSTGGLALSLIAVLTQLEECLHHCHF